MNKKGDFDFEWLPGFREMMACQNEEQNTQQETDWGNENLQIEALLPPEQLQQEEQRYWKDYEYFIQMLPMVAREVWIVADALRWFLSNGSAPGQDVRFSYEKMDASWNFINKIWNISRYILMNNEGLTLDVARENVAKVAAGQAGNVTDRWILHNLNETIGKVTENFDKFEFGVAGHILYNFIWDEFADWYVELTKEVLYSDNEDEKVITRSVLLYTLDQILRLLQDRKSVV